VTIIQKGYGELKIEGGEVLQGEITRYAEGWVALSPVPPSENREPRWFPQGRVSEVVWKKSIAVRRPE